MTGWKPKEVHLVRQVLVGSSDFLVFAERDFFVVAETSGMSVVLVDLVDLVFDLVIWSLAMKLVPPKLINGYELNEY